MIGGALEKTVKLKINMMIKKVDFRIGWILLLLLLLNVRSHATSIAIPTPETVVAEANLIVVGVCHKSEEGDFFIEVQETLKGGAKVGSKLKLLSPYSYYSLPLDILVAHIGAKKVILLGEFNEPESSVNLVYANCSFWPYGIKRPKDYLYYQSLNENLDFIQSVLNGQFVPPDILHDELSKLNKPSKIIPTKDVEDDNVLNKPIRRTIKSKNYEQASRELQKKLPQ